MNDAIMIVIISTAMTSKYCTSILKNV